MSGRGKVKSEPMKVVFINTQYVETDARSFKTVVQELTGKDAIVAAGPFESPSASDSRCYDGSSKFGEDTRRLYSGGGGGGGGVGTTSEFDRFYKEMPPMEELYKLWNDEVDVDLEELMVMEAIWLSIQETGMQRNCDSETDGIDNHHYHYHNNTEMGETRSNRYVSAYMNGESFHNFLPPPLVIVPESFEEQMMMAMAVSLAEVHATTTSAPPVVTWQ